jgi:NADH dehydrogenase [ubiquinone] 1 alpha subcomplex assembly factor 6
MSAPAFVSADYVSAIVRKDDHDRFLTAMFAPQPARDGLMALYAFNAEVAKVRENVSETMIGQIKLQWWRDTVGAIFDARQVPQGNPVVEALTATIRNQGLSRAYFEALLDARERDMADEAPQDIAALEVYAEGTSASLSILALEVLGVRDETTRAAARHAGIGWAMTGILRAVLFHARANRFLLPQDLMAAESLSNHDLQERRNNAKIAAVLEQISILARAHLDKARSYRKTIDRRGLPALLPVTLADQYLKGLARRRFDVFDPAHALQRPATVRLAWNAWRGIY